MKLYRASGQPVKPKHNALYLKELNGKMDDLEKELGKCDSENSKEFAEKLEDIHIKLMKKYPNCINIKFPNTLIKMEALTDIYGSIAFCREDRVIVGYVLDK